MARTERRLRPFYLALGLAPERRPAAEALLTELRDELATQSTLGDRIRFGVIEFSGSASVRLPLCDPLDPALVVLPPPVRGDADRSLAAALTAIRETLAADATALTGDGVLVDRPVVWLVLDRDPTDDPDTWRGAFHELTDPPGSPYLLPCGTAEVDGAVLRSLVHPSGDQSPVAVHSVVDIAALAPVLAAAITLTAARETGQLGLVLLDPELLPAGVRVLPALGAGVAVSRRRRPRSTTSDRQADHGSSCW